MAETPKSMPYVRLGTSGLKVSKIILGCMSYGTPEWQDWVLPEEESIKHIKAAYDAGINTFDTANAYSNGLSEVILGKAIKLHQIPRDEIVIMTKHFGVGSIPWSPLARGLVTRPLSAQTKRGEKDRLLSIYLAKSGTEEIVNRVEKIANERGVSMAQVALAWVMNRDGVTAPIVGTTSLENLKDFLGAVHLKLTDEEMKHLEEPYTPQSVLM
ncbi:NADP-dependent oxidoreductase domain-containing protein [Crucibulum laeve]|uniref:NADP-dependent oxidoreductase domain-containing protein n=1 Tax=Crucibulum laeve TaxID=68775 RepID=A0A5C3LQ26_9AGAR|nr:NADP-dependent oxidoreductase domain-containing protein [Crucibulum laeve]